MCDRMQFYQSCGFLAATRLVKSVGQGYFPGASVTDSTMAFPAASSISMMENADVRVVWIRT